MPFLGRGDFGGWEERRVRVGGGVIGIFSVLVASMTFWIRRGFAFLVGGEMKSTKEGGEYKYKKGGG